ncbi:MAG: hypothetical protein M5U28_04935 [Sandaracinaceae bacterium]|nr:hypothetical protein [Sandaracinaceae bacterium]
MPVAESSSTRGRVPRRDLEAALDRVRARQLEAHHVRPGRHLHGAPRRDGLAVQREGPDSGRDHLHVDGPGRELHPHARAPPHGRRAGHARLHEALSREEDLVRSRRHRELERRRAPHGEVAPIDPHLGALRRALDPEHGHARAEGVEPALALRPLVVAQIEDPQVLAVVVEGLVVAA